MRHLRHALAALAFLILVSCEVRRPQVIEPPAAPTATLFDAATAGDEATARALLDAGADVRIADDERRTPLHLAAEFGHEALARLFLQRGADPNAQDAFGFAPLHAASREGRMPVVAALIESGANPNLPDAEGFGPAPIAELAGHPEIAAYLYAHGATRPEAPAEPIEVTPELAPEAATTLWLTGANFRVWSSARGSTVEAEFVQCMMDTVMLRGRDGQMLRIQLNQLAPADQVLARQLSTAALPVLSRQKPDRADRPKASDSIALKIGKGGGWDVLEGCRLLRRSGNDGDSFHVQHNGKEYIFRLYYVDTAETSLAYPDRVKDQSRYFGLHDDQTLQLGEEAKKFTEKLLSAKPFTVVTKWEDARGNSRLPRRYAFVVTEQGDLDELLTAEGLVRVYGMSVDDGLGSRKRSLLMNLERDAKRAKLGAWGMGRSELMAAH